MYREIGTELSFDTMILIEADKWKFLYLLIIALGIGATFYANKNKYLFILGVLIEGIIVSVVLMFAYRPFSNIVNVIK